MFKNKYRDMDFRSWTVVQKAKRSSFQIKTIFYQIEKAELFLEESKNKDPKWDYFIKKTDYKDLEDGARPLKSDLEKRHDSEFITILFKSSIIIIWASIVIWGWSNGFTGRYIEPE